MKTDGSHTLPFKDCLKSMHEASMMGRIVHRNKLFNVVESQLNVRGRKAKMYWVSKPDTVAVLPINKDGSIILERQFRPAVGKRIYELPAGHIDKGERPLHAARRELEEETGLRASRLQLLTTIYPSPGVMDGKEYIYIADGLEKGSTNLDPDELIDVERVSMGRALGMVKSGKIMDAKSVAAILFYCMAEPRK